MRGRPAVAAVSSEAPVRGGSADEEDDEATAARLAACLRSLGEVHARILGSEDPIAAASPGAEVEAQHRARALLLEEKRALGTSMEELRATMRALQEDGEWCMVRTRSSAAQLMATESVAFATRDELEKVRSQLRRSREQISEHQEARAQLKQQLEACAIAFGEAVSQEAEAQEAMRQEVDQLRQVTEDLEGRLRAKAVEIERLRYANSAVADKAGATREAWRQARDACAAALEAGALGGCMRALKDLTADTRRDTRSQTPLRLGAKHADSDDRLRLDGGLQQVGARDKLQQELQDAIHEQLWQGLDRGKSAAESWQPDLQTLRELVKSKEEQLAALHRKIRFLSEADTSESAGQQA